MRAVRNGNDLAKRLRTIEGAGVRPSVVQLLGVLGMDFRVPHHPPRFGTWQKVKHKGFWEREEERLPYILMDAHKAYRELAKQIRPDLVENHDNAVKLNRAWQLVENYFARHGVTL